MALKVGAEGGDGEEENILAEINITPLTDIFLVLLIIFMVTSSVMSNSGVDVNLPKASTATAQSQPEGVVISLRPSGEVAVNGAAVPRGDMASLQKSVAAAFGQTASRLVILEGDQKAFLGSVIEVMDTARKAGAEKFAIATAPTKD